MLYLTPAPQQEAALVTPKVPNPTCCVIQLSDFDLTNIPLLPELEDKGDTKKKSFTLRKRKSLHIVSEADEMAMIAGTRMKYDSYKIGASVPKKATSSYEFSTGLHAPVSPQQFRSQLTMKKTTAKTA